MVFVSTKEYFVQKGRSSVANPAKIDEKADRQISELLGALTDPIIVMPGGWGDSLPDWIKEAVTIERLIANAKQLKGEEPTGTDAEAVAYLYTASLTAPIDSDWTQIYLYLTRKVMLQNKKIEGDVPPDIKVESINDYQQMELRRFKRWLYETRVRARQDKDRAKRWEQREQEKKQKEVLQPRMFDF